MTTPDPLPMSGFAGRLDSAWELHARDAQATVQELDGLLGLASTCDQLLQVARLAAHCYGEHLGQWRQGLAFLERIEASSLLNARTPAAAAVQRQRAALLICAGDAEAAEAAAVAAIACDGSCAAASQRVRILAVAAGYLAAQHRLTEARTQLTAALQIAQGYGPDAADPASSILAITANNMACVLEKAPQRDADGSEFMLELARIALQWWRIAGGPVEVERAEYRLAMSHLAAGRADEALSHAHECLRLASAEDMVPMEPLYAQLAIARCEHALGHAEAAQRARDAAWVHLPRMKPEFQPPTRAELEVLDRELKGAVASPGGSTGDR